MGDFGEWKAPEAQNAEKFESHPLPSMRSYDNNYYYYTNNNINNNNDEDEVFGEIVPIDTSNKRSYIVEDMMEWEAPIGDDRVGRGEAGVNGSIAERRAAARGFNAWGFGDPSINTAQFRSISPLTSPATRTPCITIPAGISPAALLDSPILLRNSQAHPSPTTGTFQLYSLNHESLMLDSVTRAADGERGGDNSCINFQLHENPASLACISSIENKDFQFPVKFPSTAIKNSATEFSVNLEDSNSMIDCLASQSCLRAGNQMPVQDDPIDILEGSKEDIFSAFGLAKTSEDGYNWRKYGQKQVKGSEFPRSYYKCTHPNCQVKKKVERSHDGEISEIIYNGAHDHPMPQPNPRSTTESSFSNSESGVKEGCCEVGGGGIVWRNIQPGYKDIKVGSDLRVNSKYVLSEDFDPISTTQTKSTGEFEVTGTLESSNKLVSQNDNDEDGSPFHKKSLNEDANLDESESKRRKTGSPSTETNVASRGAREPRVVVQIESEVDILDDGYRWRKYGQKVVKGNPNPRSYYKCTSAGCQVRKHVERACDNSKFVIMTYEGKHSHEVPASKILTGSVTTLSPTTSSSQSTYALPRNSPQAQVQDLALRIPNLGDEFMRSAMLGNFGTDMRFGASSMYQMKFPPLQSSMPYGSLLMKPNSYGGMLDFPISFLYGVPGPADVVPGGVSMYDHEKHTGLAQSSIGGQQRKENDLGFIKPKQEKIEENHYDTHLSALDRKNASSSSLYCGVTKTFKS